MSRTANIDDFVKGRMSGPPLQQFKNEMRGDAALAREVGNQQMVLNLVSRQGNSDLRAEIKQVRGMYESQMQMSVRKVDSGSSKKIAEEIKKSTLSNKDEAASVIKVILYLESYRAEVKEIELQFNQQVDQIGQPSSKVTGAKIQLTLPLLKNTLIWAWMIDPTKKLNGELSYIGSTGKESKRIEFKAAYCVGYQLKYAAFGTHQVKQNAVEQITIVPKEISFRGERYKN